MAYLQSAPAQLRLFLYAAGFGLLMGLLYDPFRFLRLLTALRGAVIALDILYVLAVGFFDFCFRLVLDHGRLRLYVICGQVLGWLLWVLTIGRWTGRPACLCAEKLRAAAAALRRPFHLISLRFAGRLRRCGRVCKKTAKNVRKI